MLNGTRNKARALFGSTRWYVLITISVFLSYFQVLYSREFLKIATVHSVLRSKLQNSRQYNRLITTMCALFTLFKYSDELSLTTFEKQIRRINLVERLKRHNETMTTIYRMNEFRMIDYFIINSNDRSTCPGTRIIQLIQMTKYY